ncbi:Ribosomal protein L16/L10AE [Geosmithia morbida]|uniref:Ribosomal protein L16/L10AE n=1 Tax=Geosmithia morbida TaxID=1094350 RepID=A0A9P4YY58_9HYPO|nr:Ribosomal protein L16/L10AE [Geosmithia morbida]KAF4123838.1 Ribosomal protein L16/L10AE [Geosmithia morbida]
MKTAASSVSVLASALRGLTLGGSSSSSAALRQLRAPVQQQTRSLDVARAFSTTSPVMGTWLEPSINRRKKMAKGRPRVATGGSTKGTTVQQGDYGLRMVDHHRRISAKSLKMAEDTIKNRLRGEKYRLYKRKNCDIGVYVSGNEVCFSFSFSFFFHGKGSFDHWATRMAVSQILFEIRGKVHEAIVRDAFRLAGNKLPGQWEFAKKGDAPVVGITKLNGVTLEELKRPRRQAAPAELVETSPETTSVTEPASEAEASKSK